MGFAHIADAEWLSHRKVRNRNKYVANSRTKRVGTVYLVLYDPC